MIGCRVAVPRSHWSAVPTPLFDNISQLLRDSFSVSQEPPIWEPPSHYSMLLLIIEFAFYRHLYTRVQFGSGQSVGCVAERGDTGDHTPVEQQQWLIVVIKWAEADTLI